MNDKQTALDQIKAIHEVFYSGDRLVGSAKGLFIHAIGCLLVGTILLVARLQELGWIDNRISGIAVIVFFVLTLSLSIRSRHDDEELARMKTAHSALHPLIKQSLGIWKALLVAGIGLSIVWFTHIDRIMALWMTLFGVIATLWGRFIHKNVERFAFGLIGGGIGLAALEELQLFPNSRMIITLFFLSAWSFGMGYLVKKHQQH